MGVLESLEQIEFLSHPVPPHQLLVHVFDRHRTLGAPLVTTLDNRETTPGEKKKTDVHRSVSLLQTLVVVVRSLQDEVKIEFYSSQSNLS